MSHLKFVALFRISVPPNLLTTGNLFPSIISILTWELLLFIDQKILSTTQTSTYPQYLLQELNFVSYEVYPHLVVSIKNNCSTYILRFFVLHFHSSSLIMGNSNKNEQIRKLTCLCLIQNRSGGITLFH